MCRHLFFDDHHHHILIRSASNPRVDNITHRAQEVLTQLQQDRRARPLEYVVRLHSFEAEREIVIREVTLGRELPDDAHLKCVQEFGPEELEILNRLEMAQLISEEYSQQ